MSITLREVTRDTLEAVLVLAVSDAQRGFVATVDRSIAQAHFHPEMAWFRAVYRDDEPVGFVMLAYESGEPPYLWRFLIDQRYQGQGLGAAAFTLVVQAARARRPDATELLLSHQDGDGNPGPFYERQGCSYTGKLHEGERVMRYAL